MNTPSSPSESRAHSSRNNRLSCLALAGVMSLGALGLSQVREARNALRITIAAGLSFFSGGEPQEVSLELDPEPDIPPPPRQAEAVPEDEEEIEVEPDLRALLAECFELHRSFSHRQTMACQDWLVHFGCPQDVDAPLTLTHKGSLELASYDGDSLCILLPYREYADVQSSPLDLDGQDDTTSSAKAALMLWRERVLAGDFDLKLRKEGPSPTDELLGEVEETLFEDLNTSEPR